MVPVVTPKPMTPIPIFLRFALLKTTFEISYKVTTGTVFSVFGKAAGKTGSPQK